MNYVNKITWIIVNLSSYHPAKNYVHVCACVIKDNNYFYMCVFETKCVCSKNNRGNSSFLLW
jgi:hypothetical protein